VGWVDPERNVGSHVPTLATETTVSATVHQVLDMRSGIGFSENYLDPRSDSRILEAVTGWAPLPDAFAPSTIRRFVAALSQVRPHGSRTWPASSSGLAWAPARTRWSASTATT
jgi:CubicO group peptidase (beta-lactamase class C family)